MLIRGLTRPLLPPFAATIALLCACGPNGALPAPAAIGEDAIDQPLRGATIAQRDRFAEGDALFDLPYRPADGLGPLYIRTSCGACHEKAGRGSGRVEKMVVVDADGQTPSADQSALAWGFTIRPYYAAPATKALMAPAGATVKTSVRVGPPLFGRGYLEAIADAELERVAAAQSQRSDGVHGRINRVVFHSEANPDQQVHAFAKGQTVVGRFGLKARVATLDDFSADAFQGDMGMTSPMRPVELPNPDAATDDGHAGLDIDLATVNAVGDYLRLIEIPRRDPTAASPLFSKVGCDACHVPSLKTRADYPVKQLAGVDAPVFTDLLLHDMGAELADGVTDEQAGGRDWRTAPLIGLRFLKSYLHDGRAKSIAEAIEAHGGEAAASRDAVRALSKAERESLETYVKSL